MNTTDQGWIDNPAPYLQAHSHCHSVPTSRGSDLMQESLQVLPGIPQVHLCHCQAQNPQYLQNKMLAVAVVSTIVMHSQEHIQQLGQRPWKW